MFSRAFGYAQLTAPNRALYLLCQKSKKGKGRRYQSSWGLLKLKAHEYVFTSGVFSVPIWVKGRNEGIVSLACLSHQVTHLNIVSKKKKE